MIRRTLYALQSIDLGWYACHLRVRRCSDCGRENVWMTPRAWLEAISWAADLCPECSRKLSARYEAEGQVDASTIRYYHRMSDMLHTALTLTILGVCCLVLGFTTPWSSGLDLLALALFLLSMGLSLTARGRVR